MLAWNKDPYYNWNIHHLREETWAPYWQHRDALLGMQLQCSECIGSATVLRQMSHEAAFRWEVKQSSKGHHPLLMGILSAPFLHMELLFRLAAKAWQSLLPAMWVRGKQTWQEWLQQWNSTDNCAQGTRNCLISQQRCTQSITEHCAEGSLLCSMEGKCGASAVG